MNQNEKQFLIYLARHIVNILAYIENSYVGTPLAEGWHNDKEALLKIIAKFANDKKS